MPGKGRRVASRQAEIGKRRRRQGRVAGGVAIGGPRDGAGFSAGSPVANGAREAPAAAGAESPISPRPVSPQLPRGITRARLDRPAAYNYVVPELRRILIMASVLLAVLIGISFAVSYLI